MAELYQRTSTINLLSMDNDRKGLLSRQLKNFLSSLFFLIKTFQLGFLDSARKTTKCNFTFYQNHKKCNFFREIPIYYRRNFPKK